MPEDPAPRIWLLHHYGGPPNAGRFARASALGAVLARTGYRVRVFYASHHHLNPVDGEGTVVDAEGVEYVAVPCRPYRSNGLARIRNMRDFARGVLAEAARTPAEHRPDWVVASLPHPWAARAARCLQKRWGTKFVLEIRDLWPESLVQLAGVSPRHPFVWWVRFLVGNAYRHCDGLVSLLPGALEYFAERTGRDRDVPMAVVPNGAWIDGGAVAGRTGGRPGERHREAVRAARESGLAVIGYTGAMGPPNALRRLIEWQAWWDAREEKPRYRLLLVGEGPEREELETVSRRARNRIFEVLPRLEKSAVPAFLKEVDAGFIAWNRADLYRYGVSPNKIWDYFAAGRPVLWAGEVAADPVSESGAGLVGPLTDPESLHRLFSRFVELGASERAAMGRRGTEYFRENGDWEVLGRRFVDLLQRVRQ